MEDKELFDKLMALAQTVAVLGSGMTITREMSALAHEITGVGSGN